MNFMLTSYLRATFYAGAKCVTTNVTILRNCKLVNVLADPVLTTVSTGSQDKKRPAGPRTHRHSASELPVHAEKPRGS